MTRTSPESVYFEMSFCPSIELVSVVRRFVGAFYERVLTDADLASRVALAAHELLENAVKYSVDGETYIRMDVRGPGEVVIRTRNRSVADNFKVLQHRLAALTDSADPDAFYQALIRESAVTPGQRGGLGIGRIASEAGMELACTVDGAGTVELAARTPGTAWT
jgi:hypothetical protein